MALRSILLLTGKPSSSHIVKCVNIPNYVPSLCSTVSSKPTYGHWLASNRLQSVISLSNSLHTHNTLLMNKPAPSQADKEKIALISAEMNMRLVNENSFLSWCRNAYLSTVVGIAMMDQATSTLAQTAGMGAFVVGGMNLFWGTGCHVVNLVRLRQASGMTGLTLSLHIMGSLAHCFLYLFILTCYIGFLDDPNYSPNKNKKTSIANIGSEV